MRKFSLFFLLAVVVLASLASPVAAQAPAPLRMQELSELEDLERNAAQNANLARKRASSQNYNRSRSKF